MAYEKKPESGALFRNDRKEKETHPDYKGDCLIDGKLYWISAWLNESKSSGTKYMSLAFKLKERSDDAAPEKTPQQKARESAHPTQTALPDGSGLPEDEPFSDDVPF